MREPFSDAGIRETSRNGWMGLEEPPAAMHPSIHPSIRIGILSCAAASNDVDPHVLLTLSLGLGLLIRHTAHPAKAAESD